MQQAPGAPVLYSRPPVQGTLAEIRGLHAEAEQQYAQEAEAEMQSAPVEITEE
jgi:hypothetical protein